MTISSDVDSRYRAMADPVRRRLLRVIEDTEGGCDVATLAASVDLHANTVRGHLEVLERAGLVKAEPLREARPGRPRLVYTLRGEDPRPDAAGYRMLAEMLADSLRSAADDPTEAALRAGREWGRRLVTGEDDEGGSVARLTDILDAIGFEPEVGSPTRGRCVIDLAGCPFRDLARRHSDIVCTMHLGMLRGAAERLSRAGDPIKVESLEPFVEPSVCRTVVRGP